MIKRNLGAVTAYALARKNGFEGTEAEWLESLKATLPTSLVQTVEQTFTEKEKMQARKNLDLPYEATVDVLPETEFALSYIADLGASGYVLLSNPAARPFGEVEVGKAYKVTVNGESYECVAQLVEWEDSEYENTLTRGWMLGNGVYNGTYFVLGDGSEPFVLGTVNAVEADGSWGSSLFVRGELTAAIVSIQETELVKLDKKFAPTPSWHDIPDKPFTKVGGDTLTWDGNTEGLVSVDMGDGLYVYKISDATPTLADFANGFYVYVEAGSDSGGQEFPVEAVEDVGGILLLSAFMLVAVPKEMAGVDLDGVGFPESGIYAARVDYDDGVVMYISTLTIPGYTGFTKEVINKDALPVAATVDLTAFESEGKIIETYPNGSTVTSTVEYDDSGNPVKITDSNGNVTVLTWG